MNPTAQSFAGKSYVQLTPGDPAPNPGYALDPAAGRYVVLCFYVTSSDMPGRAAIQSVLANRHYFDDLRFAFIGLSLDPRGEEGRMREHEPGIRFVLDSNLTMSRPYGCVPKDAEAGKPSPARRFWIVLDPTLRVLLVVPFAPDGGDAAVLFDYLERLPPPERFAGIEIQAPILFLRNVFEQEFCRRLVGIYEAHGGEESGVWDVVDGKAVAVHDHTRKRRKDYTIRENPELIRELEARIRRRVFPEIQKIHSLRLTHIERYMISCYSAEDRGYFRAHRDNTTEATVHRRFAVSVNLNADFEGGEISFPEYGPRTYKPPPGGAVVFSCGLLHAVSPVTSGRRYAFLPFLFVK
jgi:predicted 2-oxoglutarate/Fe(II)-dependent dioxygenase YbiX/peroxiredoxin